VGGRLGGEGGGRLGGGVISRILLPAKHNCVANQPKQQHILVFAKDNGLGIAEGGDFSTKVQLKNKCLVKH